ncbi:MAG: hypothetical protein LLF98_11590 [Clostridium sp.]|uniref:hypothetical protein n=1 Tax=Clostridium sp. TaxID=1506 RepID=UPI0025C0D355|nr:hypothetical protein [Clostridium sp.]MCE5221871.1 hypothetical protein [Clostridium sp.]
MRFLKTNNKNWTRLCKGEIQAKQLEINFNETGGEIMKFGVGQKIRISRHEGNRNTEENFKTRIGDIVAVSNHNIVLQFENFRESFNVADFGQYKIEVRVDKKWIQLKIK